MKTTILKSAALGALILTGALATGQAALADEYEVTIQVATHGQPIAPSAFVFHDETFSLFDIGPAANMDPDQYEGLAMMAETGDPGALLSTVELDSAVDAALPLLTPTHPNPPILFPSETNSLTVETYAEYFSAVGMLAATNDAFYGVRAVELPKEGSVIVYGIVYDAGSEPNTELLADVPAGGNGDFDSPDEPGEGHIHVHAGIHGTLVKGGNGNVKVVPREDHLNPAEHDWRNHVVEITIENITE